MTKQREIGEVMAGNVGKAAKHAIILLFPTRIKPPKAEFRETIVRKSGSAHFPDFDGGRFSALGIVR